MLLSRNRADIYSLDSILSQGDGGGASGFPVPRCHEQRRIPQSRAQHFPMARSVSHQHSSGRGLGCLQSFPCSAANLMVHFTSLDFSSLICQIKNLRASKNQSDYKIHTVKSPCPPRRLLDFSRLTHSRPERFRGEPSPLKAIPRGSTERREEGVCAVCPLHASLPLCR